MNKNAKEKNEIYSYADKANFSNMTGDELIDKRIEYLWNLALSTIYINAKLSMKYITLIKKISKNNLLFDHICCHYCNLIYIPFYNCEIKEDKNRILFKCFLCNHKKRVNLQYFATQKKNNSFKDNKFLNSSTSLNFFIINEIDNFAIKKKNNDENINEKNVNDENINEKNVNDENINDENVNDENINDENINDENVNDENINDENVNEENVNDENVNEENVNEENKNEENKNEENIKEEKDDNEKYYKNNIYENMNKFFRIDYGMLNDKIQKSNSSNRYNNKNEIFNNHDSKIKKNDCSYKNNNIKKRKNSEDNNNIIYRDEKLSISHFNTNDNFLNFNIRKKKKKNILDIL
ncbi:Rpr2, RNAse P, putative [Plasmodium relictum]|uniref:Rpr2, RNAse P, putative n=1 Tax=Plasmodium relictum TaxID=85471 RepID=A0A1J1H517_PLARL|nr:Rpr2, RNAse P, putative [Plasmodium relictum]CRH00007.1 Rpr2, RNAse P, putative [Plasmodium relictum]